MSEKRSGKKWNREETILAYDLYCRTPFGKIHSGNNDIINLAKLLGRTPGSVALKMSNLAHLDPELRKRHRTGMAHGSKLDAEVSNEFMNDWSGLSYQAQLILSRMQNKDITQNVSVNDISDLPKGWNREQVLKERVGQQFFRASVLNSYENRCCITGINNSELLIASHIVVLRITWYCKRHLVLHRFLLMCWL